MFILRGREILEGVEEGNDLVRSTFYKDGLGFNMWEEKGRHRDQLRGSCSYPDTQPRPISFPGWCLPPVLAPQLLPGLGHLPPLTSIILTPLL